MTRDCTTCRKDKMSLCAGADPCLWFKTWEPKYVRGTKICTLRVYPCDMATHRFWKPKQNPCRYPDYSEWQPKAPDQCAECRFDFEAKFEPFIIYKTVITSEQETRHQIGQLRKRLRERGIEP